MVTSTDIDYDIEKFYGAVLLDKQEGIHNQANPGHDPKLRVLSSIFSMLEGPALCIRFVKPT